MASFFPAFITPKAQNYEKGIYVHCVGRSFSARQLLFSEGGSMSFLKLRAFNDWLPQPWQVIRANNLFKATCFWKKIQLLVRGPILMQIQTFISCNVHTSYLSTVSQPLVVYTLLAKYKFLQLLFQKKLLYTHCKILYTVLSRIYVLSSVKVLGWNCGCVKKGQIWGMFMCLLICESGTEQ